MFSDLLSATIDLGTLTIPLARFSDASSSVSGAIGIGIPISATPHLNKLGLFSHSAAEKIAKTILEPYGPTITSRWMDATREYANLYPKGVRIGYHRALHGHHFITDSYRTLTDKNLSCIDFARHLGTDIVTKNGLPILPASAIQAISDALGISVSRIAPWVCLNILDSCASILAVGHAGSNVIDILAGTAHWGFGYALNTFGVGALGIVSGLCTCNPILIGAGTTDIVCGAITACDYYSQPFICGAPVVDILKSGATGALISALLTGVELIINRKRYTPTESIITLSKRIATGGFLSGLSVISGPLAITVAAGITGFRLAKEFAKNDRAYIHAMPITGSFSRKIDEMILARYSNRHISQVSSSVEERGLE